MHEHPEALGSTKLQPSRSQVIRRDKCSQLSGRGCWLILHLLVASTVLFAA